MRNLLVYVGSLAIAGMMPAVSTAAEDLDYSYVQVHLMGQDIDGFDEEEDVLEDFDDGSGLGVHGSFAFLPKFFVFGDYSDTESDVSFASEQAFPLPAETDIKRFSVGIGTNREITERLDFVARVAYTDIDYGDFDLGAGGGVDDDFFEDFSDDDSDGHFVDAGVRSQLTARLEGSIGIRYIDVEPINSMSLIGSLLFELSDNWGIQASVDAGDDLSNYMLGIRFTPD